MAKSLGYVDYYDYKVTQAEGFGKGALFEILDTLELGTRPLMVAARDRLAAEKGATALEPWNSAYMMAGSITAKLDPYFPFEKAIEQWGRSFAALGISYEGASMSLDLLDRKGSTPSLAATFTLTVALTLDRACVRVLHPDRSPHT